MLDSIYNLMDTILPFQWLSYDFMKNRTFHVASGNIGKNVLFCRPEKCTFLHKSTQKAHFFFFALFSHSYAL